VEKLSFQLRDPGFQRSQLFSNLGLGVAWGDILRAVPIEADDVDHKEPFDLAAQCGRWTELVGELGVFAGIKDAGSGRAFSGVRDVHNP
jgi:hypothetical protein